MTSIAYPTEIEIDGPWLIDGQSLQQLDSVFDLCVEKMRSETKRAFDELVEEALSEKISSKAMSKDDYEEFRSAFVERNSSRPPWNLDNRKVTVFLSGGRTVEGARFSELAALANVQNELPRGFVVRARVGEFEARVALTANYSTQLEIETSPSNKDLSLDIFGYLQNWQSDIRPKKWQQMWLKHSSLIRFISFPLVLLLFCLLMLFATQAPQENIKKEARALIRQGITPSNQLRAEQLLLEIESEYIPDQKETEAVLSPRAWTYIGLFSAFLIILAICPNMAIGIWAGRAKLERARRWVKIISVTIPGLLITGVFLPWVYHWLGWTAR